jgi:hypothetical protein
MQMVAMKMLQQMSSKLGRLFLNLTGTFGKINSEVLMWLDETYFFILKFRCSLYIHAWLVFTLSHYLDLMGDEVIEERRN